MNMKRAIVTTGGTGGHIFPALAVARELAAMHPGLAVLFVGGQGVEGELARKAGLEFQALPVRGVLGRGLKGAVALLRLGLGLIRALGIVRRFRPQVVAGFGGYAGFCPVLAAAMLGVPTAVHEQNSVPGATNRLLGRVADRVMVTYPDETGAFPAGKVLLTGNPIRPEIAALARAAGAFENSEADPARVAPKRVLVLGGSQGARSVNRAVAAAWPLLAGHGQGLAGHGEGLAGHGESLAATGHGLAGTGHGRAAGGLTLWHQTGAADFESVAQAYPKADMDRGDVRVEPFIEDMAAAYRWADLVVSRAGASTLAELAAAGKPSVLVPFPHATHDHQRVNAAFLERAGAAVVIDEKNLDPQGLAAVLGEILSKASRLRDMGAAALGQARPDAAEAIALELTKMAQMSKRAA